MTQTEHAVIEPWPAFLSVHGMDGKWSLLLKTGSAILILVCIQLLNQFLILSGSTIEKIFIGSPDARFIVGIFQQIIQAAAGILLYRWIFKKGLKDLGIHAGNRNTSLKYFYRFALAWSFSIVLCVFTLYFFSPATWGSMISIELPQTRTMIHTMLFECFFPGVGEEILFRGLIINLLTWLIFTRYRENPFSKLGVILLSSIYFATAHIYFTLSPFRMTHIDFLQIAVALGCGAFYATAYLKTRSLLAPFLAHNFANTTATLAGYLISSL